MLLAFLSALQGAELVKGARCSLSPSTPLGCGYRPVGFRVGIRERTPARNCSPVSRNLHQNQTKISTYERILGSSIFWYDCLLMPGWQTSWMETKAGFGRRTGRLLLDCGASEGAESPALGDRNWLHRALGERVHQPQGRVNEDGGHLHGDRSQDEIWDPWARLLGFDLILAWPLPPLCPNQPHSFLVHTMLGKEQTNQLKVRSSSTIIWLAKKSSTGRQWVLPRYVVLCSEYVTDQKQNRQG